MVYFFAFLSLLLAVALGFSIYYLLRWSNIVMILEDDLSEAVDTLRQCEGTLNELLTMQMFFDSKEVKIAVMDAMQDVKLSKMAVTKLVRKFTERSKEKYVRVVEDERDQEVS